MNTAHALRQQIESNLAHRIPAALSPAPRIVRPVAPVGIAAVDELLRGGLPVGALTELSGPECSGRTSLALAFVASATAAGKVCAWVDAADSLDPESAARNGVDLGRLLWVRCGASPTSRAEPAPQQAFRLPEKYFAAPAAKRGLHGGGCGAHPRSEVKGLSTAVSGFLRAHDALPNLSPRCAEPQPRLHTERQDIPIVELPQTTNNEQLLTNRSPAQRVDQALRVTDLLLQAGGFAAIILDFTGIAPEIALRVPLATWFRYRAAAAKSQASLLLLTRQACAKSSAELVLRLDAAGPLAGETTVFSGMRFRVEATRERFAPSGNVIPMRKPPQRATSAAWHSRAAGVAR